MPQQKPVDREFVSADPWQVSGYLVAGVIVYGLLGWLADRWLHTTFLVAVGIVVGAAFGIYLAWKRISAVSQPEHPEQPEHTGQDESKP